jgi:nucleotide-binding universal stress UspA family protein
VEEHERKIVVGVDGSAASAAALGWALDAAIRRGAALDVVCSWRYPMGSEPYLLAGAYEAAAADATETVHWMVRAALAERPDADVAVHEVAVPGPPVLALLQRAEDAELLVVGSRGRGGFRSLLLGSVSQHCVVHASCPVVIVHAGPPADPDAARNAIEVGVAPPT